MNTSNGDEQRFVGEQNVEIGWTEDPDAPRFCADHATEMVFAVDGWYCDDHADEKASAFLNEWFAQVLADAGIDGEVLDVEVHHDNAR